MKTLNYLPPYSLHLFANGLTGTRAHRRNVTTRFGDWRRSLSDREGCKSGTATYLGSVQDKIQMFKFGLGNEVVELFHGLETWRGLIWEMDLTIGGLTWTRSLSQVFNRTKIMYQVISDNLITNGGAETGPWTVYNGATVTRDSTWRVEGIYSCKIVVADTALRGAEIASSLTIKANKAYSFSMKVNAPSGSWRVALNRTDTDASLAFFSTQGKLGEFDVSLTIDDTNTYAGPIRIRINSEAAAGTFYGDAAVLVESPIPTTSGYREDLPSQRTFGVFEHIFVEGVMTAASATSIIATGLADHAWPRSIPPDDFNVTIRQSFQNPEEVTLSLVLAGWWTTLNNRYSELQSTAAKSAQVTSLVGQSQWVTAGQIVSNAELFQTDPSAPQRVGDLIQSVADSGDASGNRWTCGIYDRRLVYKPASTQIMYVSRGGQLYRPGGAGVYPTTLRPGWVMLQEGYSEEQPSLNLGDHPSRFYAQEIEFIAPDKYSWVRLNPEEA